jgi:hypothetical protein
MGRAAKNFVLPWQFITLEYRNKRKNVFPAAEFSNGGGAQPVLLKVDKKWEQKPSEIDYSEIDSSIGWYK